MAKECGEIEGDDVHWEDYFVRFTDIYKKTDSFDAVMYYNDEVF